ncbi:SRPBCC family protein [Haloplanus natans]|uniref:SRPBCC family protein n=1 Tax=Haloplanus natans TaxID=376171 RepID=UPI000677ABB0|nr:SRPBCC family protein [Haloplanus natans]
MFSVEKSIEIESPPGEVFSFLDDPRNHVKITPSLIQVSDIETLSNGGKRAKYRYKLAGVELVGRVEDVDRSPGKRLVQDLSGAIDGTISYDLRQNGGTVVHYEAEYRLPDTVVDTVLAPVAKAYNEREAEATVENLKAFLES